MLARCLTLVLVLSALGCTKKKEAEPASHAGENAAGNAAIDATTATASAPAATIVFDAAPTTTITTETQNAEP